MRKIGSDVSPGNASFSLLGSATRTATESIEVANLNNRGGSFIINVSEVISQVQIEEATIDGIITTAGNVTVIVTGTAVVGSPLSISVAVALNDLRAAVATKIRAALNVAAITNIYTIGGVNDKVRLTAILAAADDATLNINVANGTSAGLINDATSDAIQVGAIAVAITPSIQGKDEFNDVYYTILTGAQITAIGTVVLKVYPSLTAVANLIANDIIPKDFRLVMTHGSNIGAKYSVVFNSNY